MRQVIYIPAVHVIGVEWSSEALDDAFTNGDPVLKDILQQIRQEQREETQKYWERVKGYLDQEQLNSETMRVYSEGTFLPLDGELPIIKEMAVGGSPHFQVVLNLLEKGAKYEPAESEDMFWYQVRLSGLIPKVIHSRDRAAETEGDMGVRIKEQREKLWNRLRILEEKTSKDRDSEIATRVNQTLQDGETGILILGSAHRVSQFLDKDIGFKPLRGELVELTNGDTGKRKVIASVEGDSAVSTEGKS